MVATADLWVYNAEHFCVPFFNQDTSIFHLRGGKIKKCFFLGLPNAQGDSNQEDLFWENVEDSSTLVLFRIKGCQSGNQQGRSSQVAQPVNQPTGSTRSVCFKVHNSNHPFQLTILVLHARKVVFMRQYVGNIS